MERYISARLTDWKNMPASRRKPLILEGARQTGKTWLARELGRTQFESFVEINFEKQQEACSLFEANFDIPRILMGIQALTGRKVMPGKTLLFFDEIQFARRGLLSLKYFYDELPQLHIIAAGSLLGVIDHKDDSFPVGKVSFVHIYPLCFTEFLCAIGRKGLVDLLQSDDHIAIDSFAGIYTDLLRQYYYVGGMPEVVKTYAEEQDYKAVRQVQKDILESYKNDFSHHPPKEIVKRMIMLWESIPAQLAKENRKFVYAALKSGARARDFETSLQWLCDAGVVTKVTRVRSGEIPLRGFEDADAFKLYTLDIGLHGAMAGLDADTLMHGNELFLQYKGALTEQFALQEMRCIDNMEIHYWAPEDSRAEMDFVVQHAGEVIPVEVKAELHLRAKSIPVYISRNHPRRVIRTSLAPYRQGDIVTDIPLYAFRRAFV
ncbi:MAG: ATP-binding protein [Paludibacteraceae bacterium]|nr:ATP-binding protein [Paludibacteraceae bacterium]